MIDWATISRSKADENVELMRGAMPATLPELYVLPSRAATVHQNYENRLLQAKWGFVLVVGENRAGKSVYIRFLERKAIDLEYCVTHFEVNEEQISDLGVAPYFNLQFFQGLRLPDGENLGYKFQNDEAFRKKVRGIIDKRRVDFEFYSPALTNALLAAADASNEERARLGRSWLRGEAKYVKELREMEIYDRAAKSISNLPTDKLVYFLKELVSELDAKGLLITVDEIERVGNLSPAKGRETLFMLRNLINVLVSEDSQPANRGILNGVFLCFAISTFFLGYSQIVEIDPGELSARADREGRPKVIINDVPRLANLLKHSATMVDVELSQGDLSSIAERVKGCYDRANGKRSQITPDDLANEAFRRTGGLLAGPNIQEMIRILDAAG